MAGRLLSLRVLRSLRRQWHPSHSHSHSSTPLTASSSLLSNLLSSRFFSGRRPFPSAARKERSLIDDEAELSDWIGDLKTDSLRLRLSSDSDEDLSSRGRSGRGTGAGKFKGRERFRGEETNSKGSRGSVSERRGFYSEKDGDDDEGFSSWRERGGHGRGRGDTSVAQRGARGKGFGGRSGGGRNDFDFSDEDRCSRNSGFSSRRKDSAALRGGQQGQRGRNMGFSLSDEETGDDSDEGFSSGKKGRGVGVSARQRGGKVGQRGKNVSFDLSDEELESDSDNGFSDFGEDLVRDRKEKTKEGLAGGSPSSGLSSVKPDGGGGDENDIGGLVGEDDSYLSQKRYCFLAL